MTFTVDRVEIPNSVFEFEGENNAYLVRTDSVTILIDTGVDTPETRNLLLEAVGRVGVAVADIGAIYLTHWHPDHAGLAGYVQEISGAPVYVHERDAALVRGDADAVEHLTTRYLSLFEEWKVPDEKQHEVTDLWGWDRGASAQEAAFAAHGAGTAPMIEPFTDGDHLSHGDIALDVQSLPGHTDGQSGFVLTGDGRRDVFTGDALLPEYTANVGGADPRVTDPLDRHVQSLRRIAGAGFSKAWPGHRAPIDDPSMRARDVIDHHRRRARRILEILDGTDPMTTWEVSDALFGELDHVHIFIGPGEAHAHLDYLDRHGFVEQTTDGYRRSDRPAAALERVFDSDETS